jgi:hypothetical protein
MKRRLAGLPVWGWGLIVGVPVVYFGAKWWSAKKAAEASASTTSTTSTTAGGATTPTALAAAEQSLAQSPSTAAEVTLPTGASYTGPASGLMAGLSDLGVNPPPTPTKTPAPTPKKTAPPSTSTTPTPTTKKTPPPTTTGPGTNQKPPPPGFVSPPARGTPTKPPKKYTGQPISIFGGTIKRGKGKPTPKTGPKITGSPKRAPVT